MTKFAMWFGVCVISAVISYVMVLPVRRQVRAMRSMLNMLTREIKKGDK